MTDDERRVFGECPVCNAEEGKHCIFEDSPLAGAFPTLTHRARLDAALKEKP